MDTSRPGWWHSSDLDTHIADLRKIQSPVLSEQNGCLYVLLCTCFVRVSSVEICLNEGWTPVLLSRRTGWFKMVDLHGCSRQRSDEHRYTTASMFLLELGLVIILLEKQD